MIIFQVVNALYTKTNPDWIGKLNEEELKALKGPVLINKFISMNKQCLEQANRLNKYTYSLTTQHFLLLAWSILPKYPSAPYCKYIKPDKVVEEFDFIWEKLKRRYSFRGNCFKHSKKFLEADLKKDFMKWFKHFGVEIKYWTKYKLDFKQKQEKKVVGLDAWF